MRELFHLRFYLLQKGKKSIDYNSSVFLHIIMFCCQNIYHKRRPHSQIAVCFDCAAVGFNDCFGKRESEPDALGFFGEAAAVEAFENVILVLGVNTASVVFDSNLEDGRKAVSLDLNAVAWFGVVEGIFYEVVNGFQKPASVA